MCKGQTATTSNTSSTPNPTALAAYNSLLAQAPQVAANNPFHLYTGQLVAPFTAEQRTGEAGINSYANAAQPAISQGEGLATQGAGLITGEAVPTLQESAGLLRGAAQPLTTGQINQYMSPYTQDVVNATEQQFANTNAQQLNQVVGNAAAQGALGGNRTAVAEAQVAGQQQAAEAPVIAGLYNTAYNTGLSTAEQEFQNNPMTAAYGFGNVATGFSNNAAGLAGIGQGIGSLGISGQNAGLQGAGAEFQAGTVGQQANQAQDTALYNQFLMQQAFPYQQLSWQAGLDTGVGSLMGGFGSNVTQNPTPSIAGQAAGLGMAGAALYNSGALTALAALKKGGRVEETFPESRETLKEQRYQLVSGHRPVQMFPSGTDEHHTPHGMKRTEHGGNAFHYNPQSIDPRTIHHLTRQGRENEFLGLGPISKQEALHRAAHGEHPVSIVERRPDGAEVRASAATMETLHHQRSAMERGKDPGNTIHVEHPHETLARRSSGGVAPHYDAGGAAPGIGGFNPNAGLYGEGAGLYGGASGIFPKVPITRGPGPPQPPSSPQQQQQDLGQQLQGLAGLYKTAMGKSSSGVSGNDWAGGPDEEVDSSFQGVGASPYAQGGRAHFDTGGGADDDGVMPPSSGWGSFASSDSFLPPDQPIQVADASGVMPSASDMTSRAETGTDPVHGAGNISPDAGHSLSYGIYGLNSRSGSARAFENQYGGALGITAAPGTPEFNRQWRDAAARNPQGFADAQYAYYEKNIFPQSQKALDEYGVPDSIKSDPRVQKYVSDRYVQMGTVGLGGAIAGAGYAQTPEQFIHAMSQADRQNLRSNFRTYLSDNPQNVPGLMNRIAMRDRLAGGVAEGDTGGDDTGSGVSTHGLPHVAQSANAGVANDAGMSAGNQALLAAGLGMMASGSPYPLQQIGQGGLQGLQAYSQAKTRDLAVQRLGIEAQKAQSEIAKNAAETGKLGAETEAQRLLLNARKSIFGGDGTSAAPTPAPVRIEPVAPPAPPSTATGTAGTPGTSPSPAVTSSPTAPAPPRGLPSSSSTSPAAGIVPPEWQGREREYAASLIQAARDKRAQASRYAAAGMNTSAMEQEANDREKEAGRVLDAIKTGGEKQTESDVKLYGEQREGIETADTEAATERPQIALTKRMTDDPNFYSGTGSDLAMRFKRAGVAFGALDPNAATAQEAFGKGVQNLALSQVRSMKGTGPVRVREMQIIQNAIANHDYTPETNRLLLEIADRNYRRNQDIAKIERAYNGGHLDSGFRGVVDQYDKGTLDPKVADQLGLEHVGPLFSEAELSDPRLIAPRTFKNPAARDAARLPRGTPYKRQGDDTMRYIQ